MRTLSPGCRIERSWAVRRSQTLSLLHELRAGTGAMLGRCRSLMISLGLSIVLTVLLNVVLLVFPDAGRRVARNLEASMWRPAVDPRPNGRRVRMLVPWKAILIASLILTVVLNIALRLA